MTRRRLLFGLLAVACVVGLAGGLWWWKARQAPVAGPVAAAAPAVPAPGVVAAARISATVYYAAADGDYLVPVRREVPLASDGAAQGREVLVAALQPPAPPLLSPIPAGVTLRGFFLTASGDAYVDLGGDAVASYRAGATAERLFVYALVHTLTASLPAARRVQVLVNGAEVDSLGGHLDLREPLSPDATLLAAPATTPGGLH